MATSGSVSKGVFVYKGKKKRADAAHYFDDGSNTTVSRERRLICEDLWEQINEKIQILQSDLNTHIFDELLQFVRGAHQKFCPDQSGVSLATVAQEIPTAALVTGVNTPDHGVMFENLLSLLKEKVTTHVALLKSRECPNLRSAITKTLSQFMHNMDLLADDEEEPDQVNMNKVNCTMSVLATWYADLSQKVHSPGKEKIKVSPSKKRKSQEHAENNKREFAPLVIVMEDLEQFSAPVLQDFLTVCSQHLHHLPLVLVFGIATAVTTVHRLLPSGVSSLLCMEKFQAPPATQYLTQVIDEIVLNSRTPFHLGPGVFQLLLDIFLYHDFSVLNFLRSFQFCLLDHYYSNPCTTLCVPESEAHDQMSNIKHPHLELIRRLKSFKMYVEKCNPQQQIELLEDDKATKRAVLGLLQNLHMYHDCFFPMLRCLHCLTCDLPRHPLGKHIRELYAQCLSSDVWELEEYKHSITLLRSLSRDELVQLLSSCQTILNGDSVPEELCEVRDTIQQFIDKFQGIENLGEVQDQTEDGDEEDQKEAEAVPKKVTMYTLKQTLQEMQKKKKRLTVYEMVRSKSLDYLEEMFRKYLHAPKNLPLYEIFYYDKVREVKLHINGSPRSTVQMALSRPYCYLQNEACNVSVGSISPELPDICILYKIHLECGRLINLYDWLQAFIAVVKGDEETDTDIKDKKPDQILQARFIRAVSELQFLGFIKPTQRKTDHVARLTWGSC